jgi:hypothetical protein
LATAVGSLVTSARTWTIPLPENIDSAEAGPLLWFSECRLLTFPEEFLWFRLDTSISSSSFCMTRNQRKVAGHANEFGQPGLLMERTQHLMTNLANALLRIADYLLKNEPQGILKWMVDGAVKHLKECDEHADYQLTGDQKERVTTLLADPIPCVISWWIASSGVNTTWIFQGMRL